MSDASPEEATAPANDTDPSADALADLRLRLKPFLDRHSYSQAEITEEDGETRVRITTPWGDSSLALNLPAKPDAMIGALNAVLLPERFIALYHLDTRRLEIIWTAFPLKDRWKEIEGRKFDFRFRGKSYVCEFGDSSARLLDIAIGFEPIAEGSSRYRNLPSFCFYALKHTDQLHRMPPVVVDKPLSFWIDGLADWDEIETLDLANHINFYLGYFDNISPIIEIQSPKLEAFSAQPRARYVCGGFPSTIIARDIDESLLQFWHASRFGDPARRFLYSYRIVEYCSFSHLENSAKSTIRRLLAAPNALDDIVTTTEKVTNIIMETKISDAQKFDAVVAGAVKAETLWNEITTNLVVFSNETRFDGGYCAKPIAKTSWDAEDFATNGVASFAIAVRGIRNALSHGRDMQSGSVIAPTPHNFARLQPWAAIMAAAAAEVILFRGTS